MSKAFPWLTAGGYDYYEVASALQKSIRRGLEDDALFWATELYISDYAAHAWKRLLVIASEDARIGTSYSRMWGCYLTGMWLYRLGLTRAKEYALTGKPLSAYSMPRSLQNCPKVKSSFGS